MKFTLTIKHTQNLLIYIIIAEIFTEIQGGKTQYSWNVLSAQVSDLIGTEIQIGETRQTCNLLSARISDFIVE